MDDGHLIGNKWRIVSTVGRGGMGAVYEVRHKTLPIRRALKQLLPSLVENKEIERRFIDEARKESRLEHPNIVKVYDVDFDDEVGPYIVMELVEGSDLGSIVANEGRLSYQETVEIGRAMASALDCAHRNGLVHRDIKPGNVLIESGTRRPVLTDFGIAKELGDGGGDGITRTGGFVGTYRYSSREQLRNEKGTEVDRRADLYSLGVVLYEVYSGRKYLEELAELEIATKVAYDDSWEPQLKFEFEPPPPFVRLLAECLATHRDDRIDSAAEVVSRLEACLESATAGDDGSPHTESGSEVGEAGALQASAEPGAEPKRVERGRTAATVMPLREIQQLRSDVNRDTAEFERLLRALNDLDLPRSEFLQIDELSQILRSVEDAEKRGDLAQSTSSLGGLHRRIMDTNQQIVERLRGAVQVSLDEEQLQWSNLALTSGTFLEPETSHAQRDRIAAAQRALVEEDWPGCRSRLAEVRQAREQAVARTRESARERVRSEVGRLEQLVGETGAPDAIDFSPEVIRPELEALLEEGNLTELEARLKREADSVESSVASWHDERREALQPLASAADEALARLLAQEVSPQEREEAEGAIADARALIERRSWEDAERALSSSVERIARLESGVVDRKEGAVLAGLQSDRERYAEALPPALLEQLAPEQAAEIAHVGAEADAASAAEDRPRTIDELRRLLTLYEAAQAETSGALEARLDALTQEVEALSARGQGMIEADRRRAQDDLVERARMALGEKRWADTLDCAEQLRHELTQVETELLGAVERRAAEVVQGVRRGLERLTEGGSELPAGLDLDAAALEAELADLVGSGQLAEAARRADEAESSINDALGELDRARRRSVDEAAAILDAVLERVDHDWGDLLPDEEIEVARTHRRDAQSAADSGDLLAAIEHLTRGNERVDQLSARLREALAARVDAVSTRRAELTEQFASLLNPEIDARVEAAIGEARAALAGAQWRDAWTAVEAADSSLGELAARSEQRANESLHAARGELNIWLVAVSQSLPELGESLRAAVEQRHERAQELRAAGRPAEALAQLLDATTLVEREYVAGERERLVTAVEGAEGGAPEIVEEPLAEARRLLSAPPSGHANEVVEEYRRVCEVLRSAADESRRFLAATAAAGEARAAVEGQKEAGARWRELRRLRAGLKSAERTLRARQWDEARAAFEDVASQVQALRDAAAEAAAKEAAAREASAREAAAKEAAAEEARAREAKEKEAAAEEARAREAKEKEAAAQEARAREAAAKEAAAEEARAREAKAAKEARAAKDKAKEAAAAKAASKAARAKEVAAKEAAAREARAEETAAREAAARQAREENAAREAAAASAVAPGAAEVEQGVPLEPVTAAEGEPTRWSVVVGGGAVALLIVIGLAVYLMRDQAAVDVAPKPREVAKADVQPKAAVEPEPAAVEPEKPAAELELPASAPMRLASISPDSATVAVREKQEQRFAVVVDGAREGHAPVVWRLDGTEVARGTPEYTFAPGYDQAAKSPVELQATLEVDGLPLDTRTWEVEVDNVNRGPELAAATPKEDSLRVKMGEKVKFAVDVADPDGDDLSYSWKLDGKKVDGEEAGNERSMDLVVDGDHQVSVVASDGSDSVEASWQVTSIRPFAPRVSPEKLSKVTYGKPQRFALALPAGLSASDAQVSWKLDGREVSTEPEFVLDKFDPGLVRTDPVRVAVSARDPEGRPFERSWAFSVVPPAPTLVSQTPAGGEISLSKGNSQTFEVGAGDLLGGQTVEYVFEVDGRRATSGATPRFVYKQKDASGHRIVAYARDGDRQSSKRVEWRVKPVVSVVAAAERWLSRYESALNAKNVSEIASMRGLNASQRERLAKALAVQEGLSVEFRNVQVTPLSDGGARVSYDRSDRFTANGEKISNSARREQVLEMVNGELREAPQ